MAGETERQPGETDAEWSAWLAYRALPPDTRSLVAIAGPRRSKRTLVRWSLRWRWQDRVGAYDCRLATPAIARAPVADAELRGPAVQTSAHDGVGDPPGHDFSAAELEGDLGERVEGVVRRAAVLLSRRMDKGESIKSAEIVQLSQAIERVARARAAMGAPDDEVAVWGPLDALTMGELDELASAHGKLEELEERIELLRRKTFRPDRASAEPASDAPFAGRD